MWTYSYALDPPTVVDRLHAVRTLLDDEHAHASRESRRWGGNLVVEECVTHLLIVSDSPDRARDVNRRIETELAILPVSFSVSASLSVADGGSAAPDA